MHEGRDRRTGPPGSIAPSRIGRARETVRTAKTIAALGAAGAFLGAVALAQHGHPGGAAAGGGTDGLEAPASFDERLTQDDFFGQGDLGPSTQNSAPPAATHAS
jgi:hypothetical protein